MAEQRGIRNNNWLNVKYNENNQWLGQFGQDGEFIQFQTPLHGLRAADRILENYGVTHGIDSIEGVINRFAPPSDNNPTEVYVNKVSQLTGFGSQAPIDLGDPDVRESLISAMVQVETPDATEKYSKDLMRQARSLDTNNQSSDADTNFTKFMHKDDFLPSSQDDLYAAAFSMPKSADSSDQPMVDEASNLAPPKDPIEIFKSGVSSGALNMEATFNDFRALAASIGNDEGALEEALSESQQNKLAASSYLKDFEGFEEFLKEPTFDGFVTQFFLAGGQFAPSAISSIATGMTGAGIGALGARFAGQEAMKKLLVKNSLEQEIKDAIQKKVDKIDLLPEEDALLNAAYSKIRSDYAKRGAIAGLATQEFPLGAGTAFGVFAEQDMTDPIQAFQSLGLAVPFTAIGVGSEAIVGKTILDLFKRKPGKLNQDIVSTIANSGTVKGVTVSSTTEGLTELAQEEISVQQRFAIDDEYTDAQANLDRAQSLFQGFLGGAGIGAVGGGAADTASFAKNRSKGIVEKSRKMVADTLATRQQNERLEQETTVIDPVTGRPEVAEPAGWMNSQIEALQNPAYKKDSVYFKEGDLVRNPGIQAKIDALDENFFQVPIPSKGLYITSNREKAESLQRLVQNSSTSGDTPDLDLNKELSRRLDYTEQSSFDNRRVVEVRDRQGNVLHYQTVSDEGVGAAKSKIADLFGMAAQQDLFDELSFVETSAKEHLQRRKELVDQETPTVRQMEVDEREGSEALDELTTAEQLEQESGVPIGGLRPTFLSEEEIANYYDTTSVDAMQRSTAYIDLQTRNGEEITYAPESREGFERTSLEDLNLLDEARDYVAINEREQFDRGSSEYTNSLLRKYIEVSTDPRNAGIIFSIQRLANGRFSIVPRYQSQGREEAGAPVPAGRLQRLVAEAKKATTNRGWKGSNTNKQSRHFAVLLPNAPENAVPKILDMTVLMNNVGFRGLPQGQRDYDNAVNFVITELVDKGYQIFVTKDRDSVSARKKGVFENYGLEEMDALTVPIDTEDGTSIQFVDNYESILRDGDVVIYNSRRTGPIFFGVEGSRSSAASFEQDTATSTQSLRRTFDGLVSIIRQGIRERNTNEELSNRLNRTLDPKERDRIRKQLEKSDGRLNNIETRYKDISEGAFANRRDISIVGKAIANIITNPDNLIGQQNRQLDALFDQFSDKIFERDSRPLDNIIVDFDPDAGEGLGDLTLSELIDAEFESRELTRTDRQPGGPTTPSTLNVDPDADPIPAGPVTTRRAPVEREVFENLFPEEFSKNYPKFKDVSHKISRNASQIIGSGIARELLRITVQSFNLKQNIRIVTRDDVADLGPFEGSESSILDQAVQKEASTNSKNKLATVVSLGDTSVIILNAKVDDNEIGITRAKTEELTSKGLPVPVRRLFKTDRIYAPNLRRSESILAIAHEIGHLVFVQELEKSLANKGIRDKLLAAFEKDKRENYVGQYEGPNGFEEWYADKFGAFLLDETLRAVDSASSYIKRIADRIRKAFEDVRSVLAIRLSVNPVFSDYANNVKESYLNGESVNESLPFTDKVVIKNIIDDVLPKELLKNTDQAFLRKLFAAVKQGLSSKNDLPRFIKKTLYTTQAFLDSLGKEEGNIGRQLRLIFQAESNTGQAEGLLDEARKEVDIVINEIGRILDPDGYTAMSRLSEDAKNILLEAEDDTKSDSELSEQALAVRNVFRKIYKKYRLSDQGINFRTNYFPRILNIAAVEQNREQLIEKLAEYNPLASVEELTKAVDNLILTGDEGTIGNEENINKDLQKFSLGMAPERTLFFKSVPNKELRDIGVLQEPVFAVKNNVNNILKRWALAKRGGPKRIKALIRRLPVEQRKSAEDAVEALLGKVNPQMGKHFRAMNDIGLALNVLTLLMFTVVASLPDLAGPILRSGDYKATARGFKQLVGTHFNFTGKESAAERERLERLAYDVGAVGVRSINTMYILAGELTHQGETSRKVTDWWFNATGLEWYTKFTRVYATGMGESFLIENAKLARDSSNPVLQKRARRYLEALKVTPEQVDAYQNSGYDVTKNKAVGNALSRFVEESIVRPNAAQRPIWASDPRFALVWQLKSFFYAYGTNIVGGQLKEIRNRYNEEGFTSSMAPLVLMAVTLLPLSALGMELREPLKEGLAWLIPGIDSTDKDYDRTGKMTGGEYALETIDRAGVLGPFGLLLPMLDESKRYGDPMFISPLGPTVEKTWDFVNSDFKFTDIVPVAGQVD